MININNITNINLINTVIINFFQILQNDKLSQNGKEASRDSSKFPLDAKTKGSQDRKSCSC